MEIKHGYPHLSIAERNRRWEGIRRTMADREIDALIIRGHSGFWYGFMGDLRYVTGVNGHEGYCVFPKEGEPTVFLWFPPAALWSVQKQQSWVKDVRGGGWPFGATACGERIKELGYHTGRIGIVGLPGEREPEGIFSHGAYLDVEKTLPEAHVAERDGHHRKASVDQERRGDRMPYPRGRDRRSGYRGDEPLPPSPACLRQRSTGRWSG